MFNKALFKQSCKANGTMWCIIAFAECFMLACVMLISGSDSIGATVTAVEDAIINKEIDAALELRAINYYENEVDGMVKFDGFFAANAQAALESDPSGSQSSMTAAYVKSCNELQSYLLEKAALIDPAYTSESGEALELLASVMYAINPNGMFDEFYTSHGETVPPVFDIDSIVAHIASGDVDRYIKSAERAEYIAERSEKTAAIFLAGNITQSENVDRIISELASFGVTAEKYESFGYNYDNVKHRAASTVITYRNRLDYELGLIGDGLSEDEYSLRVAEIKRSLTGDIAASLLSSLPKDVSSALEEVGKIDLYSLVVGSIFYKLAGLLLPIIFVIMASNNLVSGQVDSGSMAYVLSTSVKRQTVVFTQAMFLICSLLAMFSLTTLTGCVCLAVVGSKVSLGYGQLVLLNAGALLVLFTLSGLCFMTSCIFDRSKRSMAIGGGLSIFSLVAAMLGLFGSPVIPKVVRLDALNNFNYVTVISLFDTISIIGGTMSFLWKFAILFVLGVIGYILGSVRFVKKDLPL